MKRTKLNYQGYEDYLYLKNEQDQSLCSAEDISYHYIFRFPNDRGLSIIKHKYSYGNEDDLFEVADLYFKGDMHWMDEEEDVTGWLTNQEVITILEQLKHLS